VTGGIGCSRRGAGEFARGNPWDLPCKLRLAPAAKDEAGFPWPSRPAAAVCLVGLGLLRCWAGLIPVSGGSSPPSLAWCHLQRVLVGAARLLSHCSGQRSPSRGMTDTVCKITCAEGFKAKGKENELRVQSMAIWVRYSSLPALVSFYQPLVL